MIVLLRLAGLIVEVYTKYDLFAIKCQDYCVPKGESMHPDFTVKVSENDIKQEYDEIEQVNFAVSDTVRCFFNPRECDIMAARRKIADAMPEYNVFLMHGSVIAKDNLAYMFTAPSGVGKTTRTKIWLDEYPDSIVVNGDKPFIKVTENEVYACGSPWCGKEGWNTDIMVPLKAIFLLERASEDKKNMIKEIDYEEAFIRLFQQVHRPRNSAGIQKTLQLLKKISGRVKFYAFRSAPTPEAIKIAYETAKSK